MDQIDIVYRFFQRQILLILCIGAPCGVCAAAEGVCIDAVQYQRLSQRYADLFSRFDLTSIAQEYVDVSVDAQDLKEKIDACRKTTPEPGQQGCDPLAKQYDTKVSQLKAIQNRLFTALNMQEYLLTLKLTLEQPQCGK